MTTFEDTSVADSTLLSDGIDLKKLAAATGANTQATARIDSGHRFWSSAARAMDSTHREIMEVSFGSARLVNHLAFRVSRFPLVLTVEYLDPHGHWRPVTHATTIRSARRAPTRVLTQDPVRMVVSESVPARVDSAQATAHPQHFGNNHWAHESWRINPVSTSKMRVVFVRNHRGHPPVDFHHQRVPYSVALKDLEIGYRVTSRADIPPIKSTPPGQPVPVDWWASSTDILGSRTVYSTYEQNADQAIDGSRDTYWRSEPMPFSFAVVNLFLDLRDSAGLAPVIDRFWVDPVTTGPLCNVYYSDSVPEGPFVGVSEAIPPAYRTEHGNPAVISDPSVGLAYAIDLSGASQPAVAVDNVFLKMHYDQAWWVGLDADVLADTSVSGLVPLLCVGSIQVVQAGATIRVVPPSGPVLSLDLDPEVHLLHTNYRLVLSYAPADPVANTYPLLSLTYRVEGYDPLTATVAIPALPEQSSTPVLAGYFAGTDALADPTEQSDALADPLAPDVLVIDPVFPWSLDQVDPSVLSYAGLQPAATAGLAVRGLVVKSESVDPATVDWFLDEGADYVLDAPSAQADRGTAQNARLRMHPMFVTETNIFGVVGGPGDRFAEMTWTPVTRDYTLKQGYMHIPPTRARYWKFEMTRLLPQVYENFVDIDREVLVFPPDVVASHAAIAGQQTSTGTPSGVATIGNLAEQVSYSDALEATRAAGGSSTATQALVVTDPVQAAQAASTGWIWTYQPWHVGSTAPQFIGTRVHTYESLRIKHSTKVAFFAGLRELTPFRVDYTFDDDTPEYVEHLLDDRFIESVSGMERYDGGVRATSAVGEVVSVPLPSYKTVRGVQFATQETDAYLVHLPGSWQPYGDATLHQVDEHDVEVTRGWFRYTYNDLEARFHTYGAMDNKRYAALEGNVSPTGYAEGGLSTAPYSPSGAGKVTASVQVSSTQQLATPVSLEIVTSDTNAVAAYAEKLLRQGETAVLTVSYTPGQLLERRTYAGLESMVSIPTTYGQVEPYAYGELESTTHTMSATGGEVFPDETTWPDSLLYPLDKSTRQVLPDLYVRVRQQGPTQDTFHVHQVNLYDSPVAWFFSNDDGEHWWQATGVRNDAHAVLMFPATLPGDLSTPGVGRTLKWKAQVFRENATINAIHIRPWYGNRSRTADPNHDLDALGPNHSVLDDFPATTRHPMWLSRFNPIETIETAVPSVEPFWRNLVPNPGAEGDDVTGSYTPSGGTVAAADLGATP